MATLFTIWTPGCQVSKNLEERMAEALQAQSGGSEALVGTKEIPDDFPTNRIAIVVGHLGYDSGAVCQDGLREVDVNNTMATNVQKRLLDLGYQVDLLEEADSRLENYRGMILLSIHADTCDYINDLATGFKVAAALSEEKFENSARLVNCISDRYATITGMTYHYQTNPNALGYHEP